LTGEEGYEAAMERSYLVRIDSVFNAVGIKLVDDDRVIR